MERPCFSFRILRVQTIRRGRLQLNNKMLQLGGGACSFVFLNSHTCMACSKSTQARPRKTKKKEYQVLLEYENAQTSQRQTRGRERLWEFVFLELCDHFCHRRPLRCHLLQTLIPVKKDSKKIASKDAYEMCQHGSHATK
jgi:hypothetical protein